MTSPDSNARPAPRVRVALLEDDTELRERILLPGLRDYGFEAVGAGSAAELERVLQAGPVDIVILDVGLPDDDGFLVAQRLRNRSPVGIVMLTGRSARSDRIRGLTEGADAYLSKPVVLDELAATLHSLSRRLLMAAAEPAGEPGRWRLGADGWCLLSPANRSIALTQAERLVLVRLMQSPGTPVTRDELIAALTDDAYDFDPHRLEMLVHRLRGKIADHGGESLPLRAVRGVGYVMLR
jgi:DNA-binding response OmpR family regulator